MLRKVMKFFDQYRVVFGSDEYHMLDFGLRESREIVI